MKRIGVLALQGDFEAHGKALAEAGAEAVEVRSVPELASVDALVIPGGESTTMLKLLRYEELFDAVRAFGERCPIFGTCAGAILLATEVLNPTQESLGLVDMRIERNAYGRQLDSRVTRIQMEPAFRNGNGDAEIEAVFIRAPIIRHTGPDVKVLARYNGDPVLAESGRHLVATFHPELSDGRAVYEHFLNKVD